MNAHQAVRLGQLGMVVLIGVVLMSAAHELSRHNTLTSFSNYRPDWDVARRAPVEHLAVEVLGRLIIRPEEDPELTQAALFVLRRSTSWGGMEPGICSQLKGWLDVRLEKKDEDADRLKTAYDLLVTAESEDTELYKTRIAAMAGDRTTLAIDLSKQAAVLSAQVAAGNLSDPRPLDDVAKAWRRLYAPENGKPINWLALEVPDVMDAEKDATNAVNALLLALLEPYLSPGHSYSNYGDTLPDAPILAQLESLAIQVNRDNPAQKERVRRARAVLAEFAPNYYIEPMLEAACTSTLRHHTLPLTGVFIGMSVCMSLIAGLWFSLLRLARGPQPVDVDAETMENVEPIDLDTDAETRIRSSANITDVG
jgi:hypothetical protein